MIVRFLRCGGSVVHENLTRPNHGFRPRGLLFAVAICSVFFFASAGWGATYHVSAGGAGDCINAPCSFQDALDKAAADHDDSTIIVASGTYDVSISGTLSYSTADGDGKLTIQAQDPDHRPVLDGKNSVQIMNINNDNDANGGDGEANITINGLIFQNGNNNYKGGGLYVNTDNAAINVINSLFENNTSTYGGGGAYLESVSGNLTVSNSSFENNTSSGYGGGAILYSANGNLAVVSNSHFSQNNADSSGGGAALGSKNGNITVSDSTFSQNNAINSGGGVYLKSESGNLSVSGSSFSQNVADAGGGGAYLESVSGNLTVSDSTFSQNNAAHGSDGGALLKSESGNVTVNNSSFENNTASDVCGGAELRSESGNVTISNSSFSHNDGGEAGGGAMLYSESGAVTVSNSSFKSNTATYGGGAYLESDSGNLVISNSSFENNTAAQGGGIDISLYNDAINIVNNVFYHNTANSGGGIYVGCNNLNLYNNILRENSAVNGGNDVYVDVGGGNQPKDVYNNDFSCNDFNGTSDCLVVSNLTNYHQGQNISANPLFADAPNGDLHLTANSPCIDVGCNTAPQIPATDFEGDKRILDGDGDGNDIVDMGADEFGYSLTVQINGSGTVTSNPKGIDCPGDCKNTYDNGKVVTLTATPDPGFQFTGWDKDCTPCGHNLNCPITMDSNKECTAIFMVTPLPPKAPTGLTASAEGGCGAGCVASVTLKWNAVRGADGHLIYNADENQLWAWVKDGTATSYTFNNLPCGRTYHFYIKTHSSYGNSQPSKTVAVQIPACSGSGGSENPAIGLVWPEDNSAINYNDFDAADYLVVFAWNQVENAKGYLLWLKLDDGTNEPMEASVVLSAGNGLIEAGNLAGIYLVLDKAGWNSLVPYTVTWQLSALSDLNDLNSILGTSPKASFTFNEAK